MQHIKVQKKKKKKIKFAEKIPSYEVNPPDIIFLPLPLPPSLPPNIGGIKLM